MRLTLLIVLLSMTLSSVCAAEEEVSGKAEIAKAVDAFTVNKEGIGTFATYVDGDHSILVLEPSVLKQKSEAWLFEAVVAAHEASDWYRCDISHDVTVEGIALPSGRWESGLTSKGKQYTFLNQQERDRESEHKPGKTLVPLFDPWTLSISSFGLFRFGNSARDDFLRVQADVNLKEVKHLGGGIVRGTWVLPPRYMVKFEVDFSEAEGFMPVQTRSWFRAADGAPDDLSEENWPALNSVIRTKWRQWEDGRWFPQTIDAHEFSGYTKRPTMINRWSFKFYWVPRAEVKADWGKFSEYAGPVLASEVRDAATLAPDEDSALRKKP